MADPTDAVAAAELAKAGYLADIEVLKLLDPKEVVLGTLRVHIKVPPELAAEMVKTTLQYLTRRARLLDDAIDLVVNCLPK